MKTTLWLTTWMSLLLALSASILHSVTYVNINANLQGSGPVAWGDYDNDGDLDVIRLPYLYRNDGNDLFTQTSISLPDGSAVDWGDYNNDGNLDILINGSFPGIFRNNGDGTFTDINAGIAVSGATGYAVGWGDYDNDGDLDIHIGGYNYSRIFRNDGDDVFVNTGIILHGTGRGYSTWWDYDNDGDSDITGGHFFRNDDGFFTEVNCDVTGTPGIHPSHATIAFGDYNNDGFLDYLTSGETGWGYYTHSLLSNDQDGTFSLVTTGIPTVYNSLVKWGDCDNDGLLDILSGGHGDTRVYKYHGNDTFSNTNTSFPDAVHGRAAWGDYNGDGILDIVVQGNIYKGVNDVVNTPPQAPTNLQTVEEGDFVIMSWDMGVDQETPSLGLNYALRVGSTPGGRDIMSPESDDSGYRIVPKNGVVNGQCFWKLRRDRIPQSGRFYWSVQAIDGAFAGSSWASSVYGEVDFYADVVAGNVPLTSTFTITPQPIQGSLIEWDFDNDGAVDSYEINPTYTYTSPGVYSIKLAVYTDAIADTVIKHEYITATILPEQTIAVSADTLRYGNVATNATVIKDLTIHNWGAEQLQIYTITPSNARYSVHLPPGISYPINVESLQSITIQISFNPLAVQAYNTNLAIISNDPVNGVYIVRLEGNGYILSPNFTANPIFGDVPLEVQFTSTSQGDIVSYLWDFGDGQTSYEVNPFHTYSQKGLYDVTLTIQDQYTTRSKSEIGFIQAIAHPILNSPNSDTPLSFGIVYLGDTGSRQLILESTGTDSVYVHNMSFYESNTAYSVVPASIPEYLLPGEQVVLELLFNPSQSSTYRDTLYIANSSENIPLLKIRLDGTGEYVPPQAPQGVTIEIDGYDAVVSWETVTQNIYNTPISVPYYFIYGSVVPSPDYTQQVFLGYSTGTTFRHLGVGLPGSNVQSPREFFYTVTAVVWYPPRDSNILLDQLIGLNKEEVLRKLLTQ